MNAPRLHRDMSPMQMAAALGCEVRPIPGRRDHACEIVVNGKPHRIMTPRDFVEAAIHTPYLFQSERQAPVRDVERALAGMEVVG